MKQGDFILALMYDKRSVMFFFTYIHFRKPNIYLQRHCFTIYRGDTIVCGNLSLILTYVGITPIWQELVRSDNYLRLRGLREPRLNFSHTNIN